MGITDGAGWVTAPGPLVDELTGLGKSEDEPPLPGEDGLAGL